MRIAQIGLFYHRADDLDSQARVSATVTHAHPVGIDSAAVQAAAVGRAVALDPGELFDAGAFVAALFAVSRTDIIRGRMVLVRELIAAVADPGSAADAIGRTVSVHESMPFAIYVFLANPKSCIDCLYTAALNGGDRDTLAAMASAVSGAYLGIEALLAPWLAKVENRDDIEILALRMAKLVA